MKTINIQIASVIIIVISVFLMGCPVSTTYPLGKAESAEKIDKALIGTWTNDSTSSEATKIIIEKESETIYKITVVEKGTMFMAETTYFKAWATKLENKTFMILQERGAEGLKEVYYVYSLELEKNKMTTHDITLKVGGTDAITSIETYRDEVKASMTKEGFLSGKIVWKKG